MGDVQLKLWGKKPRRKPSRKRPRTKPPGIYVRNLGHWSYSFSPPTEIEWESIVAANSKFLNELKKERKNGSD